MAATAAEYVADGKVVFAREAIFASLQLTRKENIAAKHTFKWSPVSVRPYYNILGLMAQTFSNFEVSSTAAARAASRTGSCIVLCRALIQL